jgi:hypothetical protein
MSLKMVEKMLLMALTGIIQTDDRQAGLWC